ncbi:Putative short-chain dehydrogenase/reductase SDR, NAD(P)-binding domain superfamily [Septoria linicola]|uniref:Short-chain dehydrogenase/reductase SDR, NAD(P)-binding domain superfamily n=1 Tax=Septoria linicola TaxID=215465 RepID=A0A9Q9EDQ7_9PEZI|nr:putative short-chain dehydrogenase/reductase SDR, NAD(P)-binding domain superfamily [Septoria linicola]USW48001.1 Putative short-chain dehydrogenase/reductase SDR, NAD(P)-binding domain superfamily [Septoria linicola]
MPGRLEGKVAIVTGGGGGFGKGIAQKFVEEGAKVVIADFVEDVGQKSANELKCEFLRTDVTKKADWEALRDFCDKKFGKIDAVINNAGTTYVNKPTGEVTDEDFDKVFAVNVKAIYLSTNVLVPYIQKQGTGGSFVTIASTAGIRPRGGLTWYNASKAAVINASKSMAVEYAKDNIRFNTACPVVGLGTGLTNSFLGKPENQATFMATIPLGRGSTPRDVANTCAFLASDEADFLTGVDIPVDGGRCV